MQVDQRKETSKNHCTKLSRGNYTTSCQTYVAREIEQYLQSTRRKKSGYNSKNTSHVFVAGFVLAILVKKSYILSRDPFMLKKYQVSCFYSSCALRKWLELRLTMIARNPSYFSMSSLTTEVLGHAYFRIFTQQ